jgi:Ser/Thr protein kinase RdoA (MazF antagonist)
MAIGSGRQIPSPQADWLRATFGPWTLISDASWSRPNSNVWCIELAVGRSFVKVSSSRATFRREVEAYSDWLPRVRSGATVLPRLLSHEESLLTLVTSAVDGEIVRTIQSPLTPPGEQRIHRAAGSAVRTLHDERSLRTADGARDLRQARLIEVVRVGDQRFETCDTVLSATEAATISRARDLLQQHAASCEIGFTHGDFQPRNWLWSAATQTLGLIDFEESGLGFCLEDFGWLFGALWHRRPDLRAAFVRGYGRELGIQEQQFLAALTALGSLQHVARGRELGIQQKMDNGRAALAIAGAAMIAGE